MERNDILNYKDMSGKFAMKTGSSSESRTSLADMLGDLIRAIGIDKNVGNLADTRMLLPSENSVKFDGDGGDGNHMGHNVVGQSLVGVVNMPTSTRPEDTYSSSMNHSRHAQLLRMDHLFEEIETKVRVWSAFASDLYTHIHRCLYTCEIKKLAIFLIDFFKVDGHRTSGTVPKLVVSAE